MLSRVVTMPEPGTAISLGVLGGLVALDPVKRLLGPTADYLGGELEQFTRRRVETIGRILKNATDKASDRLDEPGAVPPRVLRDIVNDGSFSDDPIAVEYFGGVLASSRTVTSRDDRAAALTALLSRLSTYQIRSHFIFYSSLRKLHQGSEFRVVDHTKINLATNILIAAYVRLMDFSKNEIDDLSGIIEHVMFGLSRENLIDRFEYGHKYLYENLSKEPLKGIMFHPSPLGSELFLRAHGVSFSSSNDILNPALALRMREAGDLTISRIDVFGSDKAIKQAGTRRK